MARLPFLGALAASLIVSGAASAAPALRVQVTQHGDFLLVGNTLGYDCASGTPLPVVGTLAADACAQTTTEVSDSSPDVYWESDAPSTGAALADTTTAASAARATAVVALPAGATVTHAFLYWAAINTSGTADTTVTVSRPGAGGFTTDVAAVSSFTSSDKAYESVADVTSLVQANGSGAYRIEGIDVAPFANVDISVLFGGFALVVLYERDSDPLRNLTVFDGLDLVSAGANQSALIDGFLVPNVGFTGKLGVVAYEGDNPATGDALLFNGHTVSNAQNPADNFFNSTRSTLGTSTSNVGDLPQLTGTAQSMGGIDLDVVDVTANLTMGQTSVPIQATTAAPVGDTYFLGAMVMSVSTLAPIFTASKTATDENGGDVLPGDVVTYTIDVANEGNDSGIDVTLTDVLPVGVTFVPGSLTIDGAATAEGSYDDGARTVTAELGLGAQAHAGGSIAPAGAFVVIFQVTVDAGTRGDVANQAIVTGKGSAAALSVTAASDGDGAEAGAQPTVFTVQTCSVGLGCGADTPICDASAAPRACVECLTDADCGDGASGRVCTDGETCVDGCRGTNGNGCAPTATCSSTDDTAGTCTPLAGGSGGSAGEDGGAGTAGAGGSLAGQGGTAGSAGHVATAGAAGSSAGNGGGAGKAGSSGASGTAGASGSAGKSSGAAGHVSAGASGSVGTSGHGGSTHAGSAGAGTSSTGGAHAAGTGGAAGGGADAPDASAAGDSGGCRASAADGDAMGGLLALLVALGARARKRRR